MTPVSIVTLSKAYEPGRPVLRDLSLEIAAGELFFLLGPSGCGKSTLLRLIAGFIAPDSGTIRFGDTDITALPPEKRDAAMVFQNYAVWPHLTIAENVVFGLEARGLPREECRRRTAEALALVGLTELAGRKPTALSGGQQQRVALARAVVVRPRLLLLDEPLSNLDARLRQQMRSEIRRICKEAGLTAIYVTHDQQEALTMADRMAVLHEGALRQCGTPREVWSRPADRFVADFLGDANFVPGTLRETVATGTQGLVETPFGNWQATAASPLNAGTSVTLMLRPETIRILDPDSQAPNVFEATLVDGLFLGGTGEWQAEAAGTRFKIFELRPPPRTPGDRLRLAVAPNDLIMLTH
jgi:ABC-type Fe3+/spermidine/putrescine transport system ATPase subunit